jgi:hypothetical protein
MLPVSNLVLRGGAGIWNLADVCVNDCSMTVPADRVKADPELSELVKDDQVRVTVLSPVIRLRYHLKTSGLSGSDMVAVLKYFPW